MKNALQIIYETGCRNIDAAIDRVICRHMQDLGVFETIKLQKEMLRNDRMDLIVKGIKPSSALHSSLCDQQMKAQRDLIEAQDAAFKKTK